MYLNPKIFNQQAGFSIILSLFVIVILALLSQFMLRVIATSQNAISVDVLSERAFWAAESGINIYALALTPVSGVTQSCIGTQTYSFTANGLAQCRAIVSCLNRSINGQDVAVLNALGQCGIGTSSESERQIELIMKIL